MDLTTAMIAIVGLGLCAMPFVLTSQNRKKAEKKILQSFQELAKKHNLLISNHEVCGNYAIGIDESKNHLLFQSNGKEEVSHQLIDLSTIKKSEVVKTNRPTPTGGNVLERVALSLSSNKSNAPQHDLEFYNSEMNYQISDELFSINKWNQIINNRISK